MTNLYDKKLKNIRAFSLVEISVVIVIIGILIAGITKGADLYKDFKLASAKSLTSDSIVTRMNGLTFWIETTSEKSFIKPLLSDGESINTWKDINPTTTTNLDLNLTTAQAPIYKINSINSLPAIHFSANQIIYRNNVLALDLVGTNQATIFLVHIYKGGYNTSFFWKSSSQRYLIHGTWGDSYLYFDFGTCCNADARTNIYTTQSNHLNHPKIITAVKNPNEAKIYDNGKLLITNSSASATIVPTSFGSIEIGSGSNGSVIGEIIVFSRGLNNNERSEVEKYLSQKWGIKLSS